MTLPRATQNVLPIRSDTRARLMRLGSLTRADDPPTRRLRHNHILQERSYSRNQRELERERENHDDCERETVEIDICILHYARKLKGCLAPIFEMLEI